MNFNAASVEERMKSEAEFGLFYMYVRISKKQATELKKEGFHVFDSYEYKAYPRIHKIDWKQAVVEGDINKLDENNDSYTLPQKLWIIAMKNQPTHIPAPNLIRIK